MSRPHAVPGGGSALKPPPDRPPPVDVEPSIAEGGPTSAEKVPPPPTVQRQPREQLNTKIRVDMRERLDVFVARHDSTLQGVLEAALDEYMTRRDWSWEDYQRTKRRR
jgi:hypothetical protein